MVSSLRTHFHQQAQYLHFSPVEADTTSRNRARQEDMGRKDSTYMHFYVYEDDQANQIRIHVGNCWHCNEGKGRKPEHLLNQRRWHGPFDTLAAGQEFAKTSNKKIINLCGICLPTEKLLFNLSQQLDRAVVEG